MQGMEKMLWFLIECRSVLYLLSSRSLISPVDSSVVSEYSLCDFGGLELSEIAWRSSDYWNQSCGADRKLLWQCEIWFPRLWQLVVLLPRMGSEEPHGMAAVWFTWLPYALINWAPRDMLVLAHPSLMWDAKASMWRTEQESIQHLTALWGGGVLFKKATIVFLSWWE